MSGIPIGRYNLREQRPTINYVPSAPARLATHDTERVFRQANAANLKVSRALAKPYNPEPRYIPDINELQATPDIFNDIQTRQTREVNEYNQSQSLPTPKASPLPNTNPTRSAEGRDKSTGRFSAGNSASSNRARKVSSVNLNGLGHIDIYSKPKYKSPYQYDGSRIIKVSSNSVPVLIYDGTNFYGTTSDLEQLFRKGVWER